MLKLILKILEKWACKHKWKDEFNTVVHWAKSDGGGIAYYKILKVCTICGKYKKIKI